MSTSRPSESPAPPPRTEATFSAALEQPTVERETWLAETCGDDTALVAEVRALLAAHEAAGDFLKAPPPISPEIEPEPLFQEVERPSLPQILITVKSRGVEILRRTVVPGDYVIGRGKDADIVVKCDGVSTRHAVLTVNFNEVLIEDLGSTNGTLLNGRLITECLRVWPNQKIQIGEAVFELKRLRATGDDDLSFAPQAATVHRALPEEFLRERKYEIGGLVAEGGMGAILRADEATTGRTVAMKVVLANPQPSALMRFIQEAQITSQLEHPNIVPLHELGVDEHDQVFYTMKLIEGITLRQVLETLAKENGRVPPKYSLNQLLTIFQQVCDAIGFAHSRGVIHRDLKPENIMIGEFGEVLVMDWGLAKVLNDPASGEADVRTSEETADSGDMDLSGSGTMAGSILGTPQYMSPEQARGDIHLLNERSDIYALGGILYQILALRPSVDGETPEEIVEKVRTGALEPLQPSQAPAHWPIPESLAAVALKALALDPADRYASVAKLQADVAAFQRGFATAAEQAGLGKKLSLLITRHKREAAILAAGIAVLLGIATFAFLRVNRERSIATTARLRAETERAEAAASRTRAVAERARAESERSRANTALAELRKAAPAFQQEARTLIEEQKFDEALEKNRLAIELEPNDPTGHLFRANTLLAMQRLPEAVESYRRVLALRPEDEIAKSNLQLCGRLLAESAGQPLNRAQQTQLFDAIVAQKRIAQSVPLAKALGRQTDVQMAAVQTGLKSLMQQEAWSASRLTKRTDGTFALDLSRLVVPDLSVLSGLPIGALKLGSGKVTDLSPLAKLPLKELDCSENPIRDLSPLRGLPIERLNISRTKVADLTPLAQMPLQQLSIAFAEVTDLRPLRTLSLQTLSMAGLPITSLEPLRGMHLRELDLFACRNLTNISALSSLVELQSVNLPAQINDLSFVPQLRSLQRLGNSAIAGDGSAFDKLPAVAEFLATQGQRMAREKQFGPRLENLRNLLRKYGAPEDRIAEVALDGQGFMALDINGIAMTALSALNGLPIRKLVIRGTGAADLTPLGALPLVSLDASENPISNLAPLAACKGLKVLDLHATEAADLRPLGKLPLDRLIASKTNIADIDVLRGMPLMELDLSDCANLKDLSPLMGCPRLETLLVPPSGLNHPGLNQIPKLLRISNKSITTFDNDWTKVPLVKAYLAATEALNKLRAELRKAGVPEDKVAAVQYTADGMLELDLQKLPLDNISFLAGLPIKRLQISETQVSDLSPLTGSPLKKLEMRLTQISDLGPLRGAPLEFLEAYKSPISDLTPLAECQTLRALRITATRVSDLTPILKLPLTAIHIKDTKVADVSPLATCGTLESIELTKDAPGTAALRKLPKLQRLSPRWDRENSRVAQTTEEFWAEFDAQTKAPK